MTPEEQKIRDATWEALYAHNHPEVAKWSAWVTGDKKEGLEATEVG
jgi:hypothetical protein